MHIRPEDTVEHVRNLFNARLHPLPHMAAGMKIVQVPWDVFHPLKIIRHGSPSKITNGRICRATIQRVRSMSKDLLDTMCPSILPECFRILFIDRLGVTAPWIPGEKLKGVCSQCYCFFSHVQIAFGSRKMTANFEHELPPYRSAASARRRTSFSTCMRATPAASAASCWVTG